MKKYGIRPGNKVYVTIKNKWSNASRIVSLTGFECVQEAHKFAYYRYTTNLEDITMICDSRKNTLFTIKSGFRK